MPVKLVLVNFTIILILAVSNVVALDAKPDQEKPKDGLPDYLTRISGQWTAQNKLMLHGQKDRISESTLNISTTPSGRLSTLSFAWKFDGKDQEGVLLLCDQGKEVVASFADTFHTAGGIMPMRGGKDAKKISLTGTYAAPPGPDWKWRIEILEEAGQIKVAMTNISPDGKEEPAVEANYKRK